MKLLSYRCDDGALRIGADVDGVVHDVTDAAGTGDMVALLDQGPDALKRLAESLGSGTDAVGAIDAMRLAAPVPQPRKILCLAGNYQEHIREGGRDGVAKETSTPRVFIKPATVVLEPGGTIQSPGISEQVDYELELAAVMGRPAKEVAAGEALDCVAGYTIFNDVSARSVTFAEGREPRDGDSWFDWLNGKWPDTFGPMGPYLVTADEVGDPHQLAMKLWVNDELRQDGTTANMIFTVAELVSWCSRLVTLLPGDLISTGTPSGVGAAQGRFLQPGDVIRCEIERLGTLVNHVGPRGH